MASAPVTPQLPDVLRDVTLERARQIEKGWTPEHDDGHTVHDMVMLAERRVGMPGSGPAGYYSRERLVQGIAILVAAVEAIDRRDEAARP